MVNISLMSENIQILFLLQIEHEVPFNTKIRNYCKIQSPRPICVPHDYFMVDRFQVT
jgi:hypothetical protein